MTKRARVIIADVIGGADPGRTIRTARYLKDYTEAQVILDGETQTIYWHVDPFLKFGFAPADPLEDVVNEWAMDAFYNKGGWIIRQSPNWEVGDEIRGGVFIKHKAVYMPFIDIPEEGPNDHALLDLAEDSLSGAWLVEDIGDQKPRRFFAEDAQDLVTGKMIFG